MMPSPLDRTAVTMIDAVVGAAARALALGGAAGLLLAILHVKRAAVRLCAWTVVLAAAMLMPAIARVAPAMRVPVPIAAALLNPEPERALQDSLGVRNDAQSVDDGRTITRSALHTPLALRTTQLPIVTTLTPPAPAARAAWIPQLSWPTIAAAVYLFGVVILLSRIIAGWAMAVRLDRWAEPVTDPTALARLRRHAAAMRLARAPRLADTPEIFVPMTMRVTRPVVLLPADWREWDAATLDAVLVHELAHIRRGDALTQRLSLFYRALAWFSPFSWWLHRHIVELGEQASDDAALAAGADRAVYAETLIGFFAAIGRATGRADWHVAMASGASVERRVERILNWTGGRVVRLTTTAALGIVLTVTSLAVLTASVRPVARSAALPAPMPPTQAPPPIAMPELATAATDLAPASRPIPALVASPQAAAAVGRAEMSDALMIVLLFDVRTSSPEIRRRAIDAASRELDAEYVRFTAGLARPHVWRVATVGSSIDTLQDFTWDQDELKAALARVAAAPAGAPSGGVNMTAIGAMCSSLAGLPSGEKYFVDWPELHAKEEIGVMAPIDLRRDAKGVHYFIAGASLTPAEAAGIEGACQRPNVAYAATTIPASAAPTHVDVQAGAWTLSGQPTTPGQRMIGLIFDVSTLPGTDRDRALVAAQMFVDSNLTPSDRVSVAAFGSTLELVQDFTDDKARLRAALATVRDLSVSPPSLDSRLGGIAKTCRDMSVTQIRTGKLFDVGVTADRIDRLEVHYYSTGVTRGLLAPIDLQVMSTACTGVGVQFVAPQLLDSASFTGARSLSSLLDMERSVVVTRPLLSEPRVFRPWVPGV